MNEIQQCKAESNSIAAELGLMLDKCESLEKLLTELTSILDPILSASTPRDKDAIKQAECKCLLASEIRDRRYKIENSINKVRDIMERVSL